MSRSPPKSPPRAPPPGVRPPPGPPPAPPQKQWVFVDHIAELQARLDAEGGSTCEEFRFNNRGGCSKCRSPLDKCCKYLERVRQRRVDGWELGDAAREGMTTLVAALVEQGGLRDVNARGYSGWTPLHAACERGKTSTVKYLLSVGADPNLRDNYEATPMARGKIGKTLANGIALSKEKPFSGKSWDRCFELLRAGGAKCCDRFKRGSEGSREWIYRHCGNCGYEEGEHSEA